ncbi:MAG: hypothetical protein V4819_23155 [Verrucomicrobiota bacterium]
MKVVFTWLMVLCALVGLNLRVVGADAGRVDACSHVAEPCCEVDHHDAIAPDDPHGGGDECPPGHHHHHHACCCSPAMPLVVENEIVCRSGVPGSSLLGFRHEGEIPPEGPFLGLEKPPLI